MRALIAAAAMLFAACSATAQPWSDPDLGRSIREGHATRDDIWLLGESGKVIRLARATGERTILATSVRDLLVEGDRLWALVHAEGAADYTIRDLRQPGLETLPSERPQPLGTLYLHPSEYGVAVGLLSWPHGDRPALLMQQAVITPTGDGWKRWRIAAELGPYGVTATPDGQNLYVGYNRGEWGGGLRRIDLPSGAVSFVTETSENLCSGTLDAACEPVVGLFPDRRNPECVTVGAGLAHLGSSFGRVYRVCGAEITLDFSTPAPVRPDGSMMTPQPWPLHSMVPTADGWIGLSRERYFRNRDGRVDERPMPAFKEWSGIRISDETEGVLFVVSACCWGSTDLILYSTLALPVAP